MARRGFTLVEALVTILLVGLSLVGVMGGIRALTAADVKARTADLLQKLAAQKMDELSALADVQTTEDRGDFAEQGYPNITWTVEAQPSGAENVDEVTVTATQGQEEQSLTGLIYMRPVTGGTTP